MQFILICNNVLRIIRICIRAWRCYKPIDLFTGEAGRSMYVCVCNGLTTRQVGAAATHCSSIGAVYRHLGVRPQCGKCIPTIRATVNAAHQQGAEELASEVAAV
jgi:bacterioferritin-associated ferredoxin